jgi:hypothetical protein
MLEIEAASIVSGNVNDLGNLILTTHGGTEVDAGAVMDPLLPGTTEQYYRGDKSWQTLDKASVGLNNVDNTSDVNKPVSTAQAAANTLLAKGQIGMDKTSGTISGIGSADSVVGQLVAVSLVAGRRYRAEFKCTSTTASTNSAIGIALVKSVTTDTTNAGSGIEDGGTFWTAPVANSGRTHIMSWVWVAAATETVNLKATVLRVVGSSGIDISTRRLVIIDDGKQF